MIHLIVQINVREERLPDFLRLLIRHRDTSRLEPGCVKFDAVRGAQLRFAIYETWFDADALAYHRTTPHYVRWRAAMPAIQDGERTHEEFRTLKTVFANGCWDLLHAGHLKLLSEAASLGDFLTVAVNSDASVRRLKGPSRPIVPQAERVRRLEQVAGVGEVVVFDSEEELVELVRERKPDVLVKGSERRNTVIPGAEFAQRVHFVEMVPGVSTTALLASLRGLPFTSSIR